MWRCEDCGMERTAVSRRGPRRRLCKSCQNNRAYRAKRPDMQRLGSAERRRWLHRITSRRSGAAEEGSHTGA